MKTAPQGCCFPHFPDEGTKAQGGKTTFRAPTIYLGAHHPVGFSKDLVSAVNTWEP